jgi:hypothetical protein
MMLVVCGGKERNGNGGIRGGSEIDGGNLQSRRGKLVGYRGTRTGRRNTTVVIKKLISCLMMWHMPDNVYMNEALCLFGTV